MQAHSNSMKKIGLTGWILICMGAGVIVGLLVHYLADPAWIPPFDKGMSVITDVFLRLIKMIIAPLVFSTLVTGIAKLGDVRSVGRIGGKTLAWFVGASLLSLILGLIIMNIVRLGHNLHLPIPEDHAAPWTRNFSAFFPKLYNPCFSAKRGGSHGQQ